MSDDKSGDDKDMPLIELEDGDAAIVIRTTGDVESFMPVGDDEDTVTSGSPALVSAVLMYILTDENRYRALEEEFLDLCHASQKTDKRMMH